MAVVQANDELLEDPTRLLLRQAPVRSVAQSVVEEVPPLSVLHCNGQMRGRQKHLVRNNASLSTDPWCYLERLPGVGSIVCQLVILKPSAGPELC